MLNLLQLSFSLFLVHEWSLLVAKLNIFIRRNFNAGNQTIQNNLKCFVAIVNCVDVLCCCCCYFCCCCCCCSSNLANNASFWGGGVPKPKVKLNLIVNSFEN